ncbi:uncharacterized protein LOC131435441 [Malaya genurostris]|uniref:uncharacterized protein LOC131435441 n=1 Tax=Malaya genurostris TaxID=325434 RepID=UPI0026F3A1C3|nr:uncharacterized protein LOC131435441 [Malaya genurostris]
MRQLVELPKSKREVISAEIISKCPQFEMLYKDHNEIRDIHSLTKISDHIKLAMSVNATEKGGKLIMTRVLQVVGEFMKNTLESPKLSDTTSELLLLQLPKNTRAIITGLRNSLSHAHSLHKRMNIEANRDSCFFIGVQNDLKKINDAITDILYKNKIKIVRCLLEKIVQSENFKELDEIAEISKMIDFTSIITTMCIDVNEQSNLDTIVKRLSECIIDKTDEENKSFDKLNKIFSSARKATGNIQQNYVEAFVLLQSITQLNSVTDSNSMRQKKFVAAKILQKISTKIDKVDIKYVLHTITNIAVNVVCRYERDSKTVDILRKLMLEVYHVTQCDTYDIQFIEELGSMLRKGSSILSSSIQSSSTKRKYDYHLSLMLFELEIFLKRNALDGSLSEISFYKKDKKLQAVLEMILLDIISMLDKHLENNLLFIDECTPILTGKCLRNHLAHDNTLGEILLSDPSASIVSSARKLLKYNCIKVKEKLGKAIIDDPIKTRYNFENGLKIVSIQENFFFAMADGDLVTAKDYIKQGADVYARDAKQWTALHYASKAANRDVVSFIINQGLNASQEDMYGQNPLHIAAEHGRTSNVRCLLKNSNHYIDKKNNYGKTAVHLAAANGRTDTVELLLKYKANPFLHDNYGATPLYFAIMSNHIDVVKLFLPKNSPANIIVTKGGYSALHAAAELGHLELVKILLESKSDVNATNDKNWMPLHAASLNGHTEVVKMLIQHGADVNCKILDGCTPLHYAVETGRLEITKQLLEHGAYVDPKDKTFNNTPLHYAAKDGYKSIVDVLLTNRADVNAVTVDGTTPLHLAATQGKLEIISTLLTHGAHVHAKNLSGDTPLHSSMKYGQEGTAKLLINRGAAVDDESFLNRTPLHHASMAGHVHCAELLLKNKANVNVYDTSGNSPLHYGSIDGNINIIELLIENGANINSKNSSGMTPLHLASFSGHLKACSFLIKHNADVNIISSLGATPLHSAIMGGRKDVVNLLIANKALVDITGVKGHTPLYVAVLHNHKDIVEVLLENKANIHAITDNFSVLEGAIKNNNLEMVRTLVDNHVDVDAQNGKAFKMAVLCGYKNIVKLLISKASMHVRDEENNTLLHLAATRGHLEITQILITAGISVDALGIGDKTPLHMAAVHGHANIAEILIANGANVNIVCSEGTPLHIAAACGNDNVVEVLLKNDANTRVKDWKKRSCLELAVANGHLQIVKTLMQDNEMDLNAKGNDGWTILHIAAQTNSIEMVEYITHEGSDIHATNDSGSKPIHIAAREGFKAATDFFLSKGLSVNERGASNQTLLHYAAMKGHSEVVIFLILRGAEINAKDISLNTPLHIATNNSCSDIVKLLLQHGAYFNGKNILGKKPLEITEDETVIKTLTAVEEMFIAVRANKPIDVQHCIKKGAVVDSKNSEGGTSLHYASWKGYENVVTVLLENGANPNMVNEQKITPLHYAVKFSHLAIVEALLCAGAHYDAISECGETPASCATEKTIINLFKVLSKSFSMVKSRNIRLINDLNRLKDLNMIKLVMSTRDRNNNTLMLVAVNNNYPKIEQLKQIGQTEQQEIIATIGKGEILMGKGDYKSANVVFQQAFEKRRELFGSIYPGTLNIQTHIAKSLYAQGAYREALVILQDVYDKYKTVLGPNDKDTLNTQDFIALILHRQGKNEEAILIYRDVVGKLTELFGAFHSETLDSKFHMALVLTELEQCKEALTINREVYAIRKEKLGAQHCNTIRAQNNIALVLAKQGEEDEALNIYNEVLAKKRIVFGVYHVDTLRTMNSISSIFLLQHQYDKALEKFQEIANYQKTWLGPDHPETLMTQHNIANVLYQQGNWISALKTYSKIFCKAKAVFGPNHETVCDIMKMMKIINKILQTQGYTNLTEIHMHLQNEISIAAANGDIKTVQRMINEGDDTNGKDLEGRTPLHYAVNSGLIEIVKLLLSKGADVTQATNKGNTPLHTAASKGNAAIVEELLQQMEQHGINDFINSKTTATGTTSLHIAAKNGYLDVTKILLKRGAAYNPTNNDNKTPLEISGNRYITYLLELIAEAFAAAKNGNIKIINKLQTSKVDFTSITNARNEHGHTVLQVAIVNKQKHMISELLQLQKQCS